jgi:long-chain acyl-CoA synthetase
MEAQAVTASTAATGSRTLADLLPLSVHKRGELTALRHKDPSTAMWTDVSYQQLGQMVEELSLGLQELGVERGDKAAILSNTRPEWTYVDFAALCAGATVVPIYQTNSPEECEYVLRHSDTKVVVVEDLEQLEKVREVRERLGSLEHVITIEAIEAEEAITLADLRERGKARSHEDFEARVASVEPSDVATYIYTSGTTGAPKGCVIDHANWRDTLDMVEREDVLVEDESVYLFLPIAHSFARVAQLVAVDVGATIAYWEKDPLKIIPNLAEIKPSYFPSVPRIFEKIYALATGQVAKSSAIRRGIFNWAIRTGRKVRELERRGQRPNPFLARQYAFADGAVLSKVRGLFGGKVKQCVTGAAPISPEILEFFWACGVLILEGYGMTETSAAATINRIDDFKFGTVGKPLDGVELRIAADGEVLIKGPNLFRGYYKDEEATRETLDDGWIRTGDLGVLDTDGFLVITGRKKDIIITAGGKNITPANLENGLKQNQYISQAVVYGDRRPYLAAMITLDPEEIAAWATEHGLGTTDVAELSRHPAVEALVQQALDAVNEKVARVEQVKKFTILPHDITQETGELTPTLKVKRNVVYDKYASLFDAMYAEDQEQAAV